MLWTGRTACAEQNSGERQRVGQSSVGPIRLLAHSLLLWCWAWPLGYLRLPSPLILHHTYDINFIYRRGIACLMQCGLCESWPPPRLWSSTSPAVCYSELFGRCEYCPLVSSQLSAIFKSTPGRLTMHYASASSPLSGYSNPDRGNWKKRNTNQLEAAPLNLIKTKCNHRGFEFGGPKPWNVSQTSNMQRQCCFIWFGVYYPLC